MGEPYFYLRADERVLLRTQPPLTYAVVLALVPTIVLAAVSVGAWLALGFFLPQAPAWAALAVGGALVLLIAFAAWRRAATTEYALTDERIYSRAGKLVTRLHFTTHDKVTDIGFRQGPLERAFGLSSITFATAGGEVSVAGVRDAMAIKAAAETARDAFIRRLLREAPGAAAATAPSLGQPVASHERAPVAPPPAATFTGPLPSYLQAGDAPVWSARPRLVAAMGSLRSLLGLIPVFFFSPMLVGSRRILIPILALGLVLMFIGIRIAQLKRAEYIATDRRVYARAGLVGTTVNQLTYDKITDITFHQDLFGRLFGYGGVTLQTAGGSQAPITMIGLADPLAAKETIERWRDAAVGATR